MSDSAIITCEQLRTVVIATESGSRAGDLEQFGRVFDPIARNKEKPAENKQDSRARSGLAKHNSGGHLLLPGSDRGFAFPPCRGRAFGYAYAMKRHTLVLGMLAIVSAPCAFAASFDCSKAATATEKLICSDTETSALDSKLQQAYKTALAATNAYGKKVLAKEQRNWIIYTRGICQDTACLRKTYTDRISVLARNEKFIVDGGPYLECNLPNSNGDIVSAECVNVVPYRDPNVRINSFNQSLKQEKLSGKIIGCSRLIDLPVGNPNSNESFGGVCVLQDGAQRTTVEICNANMTGKFRLQPIDSRVVPDKQLIDFTYTNCYGGY